MCLLSVNELQSQQNIRSVQSIIDPHLPICRCLSTFVEIKAVDHSEERTRDYTFLSPVAKLIRQGPASFNPIRNPLPAQSSHLRHDTELALDAILLLRLDD
jgi:hypothetical protein